MNYPTTQQYADLADDVYKTRQVTRDDKSINIGGHDYKVLAVHANPQNGYYGAVYQDIKTNAVIVTHRGTEPLTLKDWQTNWGMVADKTNRQANDANKLTELAFDEVNKIYRKDTSRPTPTIIQNGHSLGGNHAQTQAYRHGQRGVTFNAYGAAIKGIPEGGDRVTNYIRASDPVAAAAPHYGREVLLATENDISRLKQQGYGNSGDNMASRAFLTSGQSVGAHLIGNFTGPDSILSEPNYSHARRLADENRHMIEDYRGDVEKVRGGIHQIKQNFDKTQEMYHKTRELIDKDPNNMSYNDSLQPAFLLGRAPDISQPLPPNASDAEFIDYAFAALLSDDEELHDKALESLMASDQAKQFERESMQAAIDYDREQEMLRPRGPVMSL